MKDIKLLRSGVIDKITSQGDEKVSAKEKAVQEELSAYSAQSDSNKERELQRITEQYKDLLNQQKQSYNNQKRNDLLAVKEGIIKEVLDVALAQLSESDGDQLLAFIDRALSQVDSDRESVITFGEQTKDKVSSDLLKELKKKNANLQVNDDVLERKSGFLLEQDGIEYNYLFEDLIKEIEPELKVDISKEVF